MPRLYLWTDFVSFLNPLWSEAAVHSYVQSIEQNTTPLEFVQIRLTDVDQRKIEARRKVSRIIALQNKVLRARLP